jgi:hypothetical protein
MRNRAHDERDPLDWAMTISVIFLFIICLICLIVYFNQTLSTWLFDYFNPEVGVYGPKL